MNIRSGLAIAKSSFLEVAAFRAYFVFTIIGNIFYVFIMYFLWQAIFKNVDGQMINGMNFQDTFVYLALAGGMGSIITVFVEWIMSRDIKSGNVSMYLVKPIDYQLFVLSKGAGDMISNLIIIFIPNFVIVYFISGGYIKMGLNILFFLLAFIMAAFISLTFDFLIGLLSFYTENVWGISAMKDTVVLLLSGAVVPIAFFPEKLKIIAEFLPFQAVYNLPLQVLINKSYGVEDYIKIIALQLFWAVLLFLLSRMFYKHASKAIIINGG